MSGAAQPPRLVVFADDWGRHPSSAQHLVRELLPRWSVDWVETVGTRRPSLSAADLRRALGKLRTWTRPAGPRNELPPGLAVHAPRHWPGFAAGWERRLNARLLERAVGPLVRRADAVVATAPVVADLAERIPEAHWVYYCVDDLAEWPGLDAEALRALERDFVPRAKRIVAASEALAERMRRFGRDSEVVTHGVDLRHWSAARERGPRPRRERPSAIFWGAVDRRLDAEIVLALAQRCDVSLVGPLADPDPRLLAHPAIRRPGAVAYAELPRVALEADVLVMPYADLPVTRAMQPLKLKEYLATGLPVVATPLPANRAWEASLDFASEPAAFAERALARAFEPLPPAQVRDRVRLGGESWIAKALAFERALRGEKTQ